MRFRRTLVGLKLFESEGGADDLEKFQTHPCGVEVLIRRGPRVTVWCFRRTLVGLKLGLLG